MNRFGCLALLAIICCSRLAAAPRIESEPPVSYDDFKLLPIEGQLETAWDLYYSDLAAWRSPVPPTYRNSDFDIVMNYIKIINESGETEKIEKIALERLSGLDAIDFTENDVFVFFTHFLKNHIPVPELLMLHKKKLHEQLTLYKLINYNAIRMNERIENLEYLVEGKDVHIYTGEDGYSGEIYIYNKYTAIGFEDLQYDEHLLEGYKRLSVERQIHHIWNEWQKERFKRGPMSPSLIHKIELLMERREESIPWMYNFLQNTREEEREDSRSHFSLTVDILYFLQRDGLLNDNEKKELANVYRQKLDEYIRNYGKVTSEMMNRYVMINYLDTGIWIGDEKEWEGIADILKAKYKELGYEIYRSR
jgi:hypothetical protein